MPRRYAPADADTSLSIELSRDRDQIDHGVRSARWEKEKRTRLARRRTSPRLRAMRNVRISRASWTRKATTSTRQTGIPSKADLSRATFAGSPLVSDFPTRYSAAREARTDRAGRASLPLLTGPKPVLPPPIRDPGPRHPVGWLAGRSASLLYSLPRWLTSAAPPPPLPSCASFSIPLLVPRPLPSPRVAATF